LKIDQVFIQKSSSANQAIVKTIIALAKNLQLTVVAKGVETAEQEQFLQESQCDEVQGYLYAKPLSTEQIEVFLRDNQ